jgi:hypothetical protein
MSTLTKIKSILAENSKVTLDQNLQEFGDTPRPMTTNTRQYDPKSSRISGIPFSLTGERLAREKGKEYQSVLGKPANPMKMNDPSSAYSKTSGGMVKFPKPPEQAKPSTQPTMSPVKVVEPNKSVSVASTPVTASIKGGPNQPPSTTSKMSMSPKPYVAPPSKPAAAPVVKKSLPAPDTLKQQVGVTARASQSPSTGKMSYSNAPRGSSFAAPSVSNMKSAGTSSALSATANKATSAASNLNKATSTFGDISAKLSKMGY